MAVSGRSISEPPGKGAKMFEFRFKLNNGDEERVVIAGDVVALPFRQWCGSGYGQWISEEWMLHSGNLPKVSAALRGELARGVVAALEARNASAERERERIAAAGNRA